MATIQTTSNPTTWYVDLSLFSEEEARAYVSSLTFSPSQVRTLFVDAILGDIYVNGIAFRVTDIGFLPREEFDETLGSFAERDGNKVSKLSYYSDREMVEAEYFSHPLDPCVPNTRHSSSDFGSLFRDMFDKWQTAMLAFMDLKSSTPTVQF